MESKEFAQAVREERDSLLSSFANPSGGTVVAAHLLAAAYNPRRGKRFLPQWTPR
jgi:hypothetical protein